jgi:hypothetical protein
MHYSPSWLRIFLGYLPLPIMSIYFHTDQCDKCNWLDCLSGHAAEVCEALNIEKLRRTAWFRCQLSLICSINCFSFMKSDETVPYSPQELGTKSLVVVLSPMSPLIFYHSASIIFMVTAISNLCSGPLFRLWIKLPFGLFNHKCPT